MPSSLSPLLPLVLLISASAWGEAPAHTASLAPSDAARPFLLRSLHSRISPQPRQLQRPPPQLLAKAKGQGSVEPLPSAKLLDVVVSTGAEVVVLLLLLRGIAYLLNYVDPSYEAPLVWVAWTLLIQLSSMTQGIMQRTKTTISPEWYDKLAKPGWTPPTWAFPAAWIPLKLLQGYGASLAWSELDLRTFTSPTIVLFLVHLALGDTWNRQFFLKQRKLTGVLVIYAFWLVLIASTVLLWMVDPLCGGLVAPTIAWVAVASALNLDIWYLNRA